MTLKTLAVRVPEETEREIREMAEHEKLDKATAVRALLQRGSMTGGGRPPWSCCGRGR